MTETATFYPKRIKTWLTRLIARKRIAHAYLFSGPKGAGKRNMALYFAQSLFCEQPENHGACLTCPECIRVANLNHPDIHFLAPEGASIKIEQIRDLQKEFSYRGVETGYKVYIINQAEKLTTQAANSLLKFLEDPYPGTIAILITEQAHLLLPTLLSRLQQITFDAPAPQQLCEYLAPQLGKSMAHLLSHLTTDLEEAIALGQAEWFADLRNLVIQLTEGLLSSSKQQAFFLIQEKWLQLVKEKEQTDIGLSLLLFWYRDLLYTHLDMPDKYVFIDYQQELYKQAVQLSRERVAKAMEAILQAKQRLQTNVHPGLLLEQLVLRLQEG